MTPIEVLDRLAIGIIERSAPEDPAMERLHDTIERTPLVLVPLLDVLAGDGEQARRLPDGFACNDYDGLE